MSLITKNSSLIANCLGCPRECKVNRNSDKLGFCKSTAEIQVSSVCIHKGEEPVISGEKGICNVFFPHCNLQCVFCQNYDISNNAIDRRVSNIIGLENVVNKIIETLQFTENVVGFVSPSHYALQMVEIIRELRSRGFAPTIVYNSNGYDKPETLRMLKDYVDIYVPDFKYSHDSIALELSKVNNYKETALNAIKEMYWQKGSSLIVNDRSVVESGLIIRHLILPNNVQQSIDVLKIIAEEISINVNISLMAQYTPTKNVATHTILSRAITKNEYQQVVDVFYDLGFHNGWIQDFESQGSYLPDFNDDNPFEK